MGRGEAGGLFFSKTAEVLERYLVHGSLLRWLRLGNNIPQCPRRCYLGAASRVPSNRLAAPGIEGAQGVDQAE